MAFVLCVFFYAFFTGFSVTVNFNLLFNMKALLFIAKVLFKCPFDAIFFTYFNLFFASVPIFLFCLFEQKVSIPNLEKFPHLYK
jgi:hypothetical protein